MRYFVTPIAAALTIFGIACALAGFVYLTRTSPQLPGFFPGHVAHPRHPHTFVTRGIVLAVVSAVSVYAANRVSKNALGIW